MSVPEWTKRGEKRTQFMLRVARGDEVDHHKKGESTDIHHDNYGVQSMRRVSTETVQLEQNTIDQTFREMDPVSGYVIYNEAGMQLDLQHESMDIHHDNNSSVQTMWRVSTETVQFEQNPIDQTFAEMDTVPGYVISSNAGIHDLQVMDVHGYHDNNGVQAMRRVSTETVQQQENCITNQTSIDFETELVHNDRGGTLRDEGRILIAHSDSDSVNSIANSDTEYVIPESDLSVSSEDGDRALKSRIRQRNPENWSKAIAKRKRNTGQEYLNTKKVLIPARSVKQPCSERCRQKCRDSFTEDERQLIHNSFWNIGDNDRQRDYFLQCMKPISPRKKLEPTEPQPEETKYKNHAYYFELNGKRKKVCKTFFMNTLNVTNKRIFTAIHKKDNSGVLQKDLRGKHGKGGQKVEDSIKDNIRTHIRSFPAMPSHYCRAETNKVYIDGSLNIAMMYRLYKAECEERQIPFSKLSMYETIFNREFNIGFFNPKKDQCLFCESYKVSTYQEKASKQEKYEKHIKAKELSRKEKQNDILNDDVQVACFDLQVVLSLPCGEISAFFYKRRLASYNFTIYQINEKRGFCFTWHEAQGKRGANEIGSCLYEYLKNHSTRQKIIFYADNCAGQNKNKFIIALLLHCVTTIETQHEITLKFLVVGHTQNEGDSMHALIEKEKKRCLKSGPLYTPSQLIPIIRLAKKSGHPYMCIEMDYDRFYNLKALQVDMGKNYNINIHGEKVLWGEVCMLKVRKDEPTIICYKNSYEEADFKKIDITHRMRNRSVHPIDLKKAYSAPVKIQQAKKKDLMDLCQTNAIPRPYWDFFKELPSTTARNDSDTD